MFSIFRDRSPAPSRRELLRVGGLSALGLSAAQLELFRAAASEPTPSARSCIFLFLFGGPSQIDLWDMKPAAPADVRGEFRPAATRIPGIQVCEHLPRLAAQMDKLCLVRSMTHDMNVHGPACSEVFSGREYFAAPTTDQADPQDWPSLSAMAMRYAARRGALPSSVVLPWYLQFPGQAKRIAGQTGGRMGERHNPLLIQGDGPQTGFQLQGFRLRESIPLQRIERRRQLLEVLSDDDSKARGGAPLGAVAERYGEHRDRVYDLLRSRAGRVLDLEREPEAIRDRYGRTMVGQSLLMARRLVEAGVSLITVNWEDETKIDGVNTCWDTHQENFPKLKSLLCPLFDQAFPALLEDLDERGLLESTLVVAVGEFGRTPHLGQFSQSSNTRKTGRDHWPSAFTALVAGGGVPGGRVYGATDHLAATVKDRPVRPSDLSATILKHLGVDPRTIYRDELRGQKQRLSPGRPLDFGA